MDYKELKEIAQPHIKTNDNLPSNAFLLLTQLHIPFKGQKQCEVDFKGKMNPLYNTPAFLAIDSDGSKVVYFNSNTKYCNFYIFHEIAHFILGHENDCPQNEMDADLLACILAAPVENLPSTIKSARDISTICQIPIDKAEMYWNEIFPIRKTHHLQAYIATAILSFIIITAGILAYSAAHNPAYSEPVAPTELSTQSEEATSPSEDLSVLEPVFVTTNGSKYHKENCFHIKGHDNILEISLDDAINAGYEACKDCI